MSDDRRSSSQPAASAEPFLRNLEQRDALSGEERTIAERLAARQRRIPARQDIVNAGDRPTESCLMLSGLSARSNLLADGRRQITAFHVAGEFVDLHSLLLSRMDHDVVAVSDCIIALVPHETIRELTETHPHFTRLLWLQTITDAAIHRQWLVAAGRLPSTGQIAHLLCEMFLRLQTVGLTEGGSFRFPVSQGELSDAMGLSVVHVNRTLQELRRQRLIAWQGDKVDILDWARLSDLAEFDPTYLNLEPRPR